MARGLGSAICNAGHPFNFPERSGWPLFIFQQWKYQHEEENHQWLPSFFHQRGQRVSSAFSMASVSSVLKKESMASMMAG